MFELQNLFWVKSGPHIDERVAPPLRPALHSFPSSVSDMTLATIPRLTRPRQGARSGPAPIVTLLFASEVSTLRTTTFVLQRKPKV